MRIVGAICHWLHVWRGDTKLLKRTLGAAVTHYDVRPSDKTFTGLMERFEFPVKMKSITFATLRIEYIIIIIIVMVVEPLSLLLLRFEFAPHAPHALEFLFQ